MIIGSVQGVLRSFQHHAEGSAVLTPWDSSFHMEIRVWITSQGSNIPLLRKAN